MPLFTTGVPAPTPLSLSGFPWILFLTWMYMHCMRASRLDTCSQLIYAAPVLFGSSRSAKNFACIVQTLWHTFVVVNLLSCARRDPGLLRKAL